MKYALLALVLIASACGGQERIRAFTLRPDRDAMTDMDRSALSTDEIGGTPIRTGRLIWRCNGSVIDLYIAADEFLNSGGGVSVQWRFDDSPPSPVDHWSVSTSGTAAFAPRLTIYGFTRRAMDASRIALRVRDFQNTPRDYQFSMMGLTEGLSRMACALPDRPQGATAEGQSMSASA